MSTRKSIWLIGVITATSVAHLVAAAAQSHTLRVKTCNETSAGTTDTLTLSFCAGGSNCITGSGNTYNLHDELMLDGAWNNLTVPVEYNPTVMVAEIAGSDAWCIEQLVWDDGPNLLGRGGKVYLDHDTGIDGCSYGVHYQTTGWFYPCQPQWRFFNLQGTEDVRYEVAVKSCRNGGSSKVKASLCSESLCSEEFGEMVTFDLELNGRKKQWVKKHVSVNFNPVAMKLTGVEKPWCAQDIAFNDFRVVDLTSAPPIQMAGDRKEERYFYNIQYQGSEPLTSDSSSNENFLVQNGWTVLVEVIIAVTAGLVLYAAVGGSSFLSKKVISCLCSRATDERPMCEVCKRRRATPLSPSNDVASGTRSFIGHSERELIGSANEHRSVHGSSPSGRSSFYRGKSVLKPGQRKRLLQMQTLSSKYLDDNEERSQGWKIRDRSRSLGGSHSVEMTRTHIWPLSSPVLGGVETGRQWSSGEAKGAPEGEEPSQPQLSDRTEQHLANTSETAPLHTNFGCA